MSEDQYQVPEGVETWVVWRDVERGTEPPIITRPTEQPGSRWGKPFTVIAAADLPAIKQQWEAEQAHSATCSQAEPGEHTHHVETSPGSPDRPVTWREHCERLEKAALDRRNEGKQAIRERNDAEKILAEQRERLLGDEAQAVARRAYRHTSGGVVMTESLREAFEAALDWTHARFGGTRP